MSETAEVKAVRTGPGKTEARMENRKTWSRWRSRVYVLGAVLGGSNRCNEYRRRTEVVLVVVVAGQPQEHLAADAHRPKEVRELQRAAKSQLESESPSAMVQLIQITYTIDSGKDTPYDDEEYFAVPAITVVKEFSLADFYARSFISDLGL